jgi:hypothetical protein
MRPTSSLIDHRLLPRAERELFQAEIVRFHLEDLNLIAERRRGRRRGAEAPERARVAAIVRASRWDRAGFLLGIRRFIDEGRATDEDAFGPTLLLSALGADHARFLAGVAPSVRKLAEKVRAETGLDGPAPRPSGRAGSGARRAPRARSS